MGQPQICEIKLLLTKYIYNKITPIGNNKHQIQHKEEKEVKLSISIQG